MILPILNTSNVNKLTRLIHNSIFIKLQAQIDAMHAIYCFLQK
jgi:hypothetical protein